MKKNKKYTTAEIVMLIFCSAGCLLMVANKFIETDRDWFTIAIALNGVGIMAFLFGKKSGEVE